MNFKGGGLKGWHPSWEFAVHAFHLRSPVETCTRHENTDWQFFPEIKQSHFLFNWKIKYLQRWPFGRKLTENILLLIVSLASVPSILEKCRVIPSKLSLPMRFDGGIQRDAWHFRRENSTFSVGGRWRKRSGQDGRQRKLDLKPRQMRFISTLSLGSWKTTGFFKLTHEGGVPPSPAAHDQKTMCNK